MAASPSVQAPPVEATRETEKLHRRALGVPEVVFFIVAASAPLTVVAGGQSVTYLVTGNRGIPLLFVLLGLVLALFTVGYAAMSRHIASAGAFYTYVAQGIGKIPAVGTAFVALVAYNAMQFGIYGLFGVALGAFMADNVGLEAAWYTWALIGWALIGLIGLLQVDLNARVLAILLVGEIIIVALFDFAIAADPGPQGLPLTGFDPGVAFGTALGAALTFSVAAFVGFEGGAIYSEECRDPKRTVARATFIAIAMIAGFYALSAWLLGAAVGPDNIVNPEALIEGGFTTPDGAAPDPTVIVFAAGAERLGAFWGDIASLLFATSLFAALLSFHNGVARYVFALGRERVLPSAFNRVSRRTGSPFVGSVTQSALAFVVLLVFAFSDADPVLKLFTWLTSLGALSVTLLLALASFAVFGYFRRRPELAESPFAAQAAPALAGLLLLAIFVVSLLNFNVLITGAPDAPTDELSIILPAILFGMGALGLVVGATLRGRDPEAYARLGADRRDD